MEQSTAPTDWSQVKDAIMGDDSSDARYAMDSKLHVQFYMRAMIQPTLSDEANRPIFADVEHIRIMVPGDKLSIVDRPASEDDKGRFADIYAKFSTGQKDQIVGTRLEAVPFMSRSKVEEYKFFGVHTVEQLASVGDEVGQKFPGFQSDKAKAIKFLEAANGTDARVNALEAQVKALREAAQEKEEAMTTLTKPAAPVQKAALKQ